MVKRKDSVSMTLRLRADLAGKLEQHRQETGVPKTFTIEKALDLYFGSMDAGKDSDGESVSFG